MSEPYWVPLGPGAGIDYEGAYNAGTQYLPGDIVTYNGREYIALNPALGQTPPAPQGGVPAVGMGTALPSSGLFDGMEFIFTDSLTAPTYSWRLRYVAAKASNKWVFVGGPPLLRENAATEVCNVTTYGIPNGPDVTVPVSGDYIVRHGFQLQTAGGAAWCSMSYAIGAAAAVDADSVSLPVSATTFPSAPSAFRERPKTGLVAGTVLASRYKMSVGSCSLIARSLAIVPIAVGG